MAATGKPCTTWLDWIQPEVRAYQALGANTRFAKWLPLAATGTTRPSASRRRSPTCAASTPTRHASRSDQIRRNGLCDGLNAPTPRGDGASANYGEEARDMCRTWSVHPNPQDLLNEREVFAPKVATSAGKRSDQRELFASRQLLDPCLFATCAAGVWHRQRDQQVDRQPRACVPAAGPRGVCSEATMDVDGPAGVQRIVCAAKDVNPRRRRGLRLRRHCPAPSAATRERRAAPARYATCASAPRATTGLHAAAPAVPSRPQP